MVNSYNIVQFECVFYPLNPPFIAGLFVVFIIVERIAPKLTVFRKRIGRASCNGGGFVIFIELKKFFGKIDIRRIECGINRNVTDDFHALFIAVFFEC